MNIKPLPILLVNQLESRFKEHCGSCPGKCCSDCSFAGGYFRVGIDIPNLNVLEQLKKKYNWTKTKGFKGKISCKLPRALRSRICLAYSCQPTSSLTKFIWEKWEELRRLTGECY